MIPHHDELPLGDEKDASASTPLPLLPGGGVGSGLDVGWGGGGWVN